MNYDTFTPKNLKTVRSELQAALDLINLEGLTFELGTLRYSKTECTVKLTINNAGHADKEHDELVGIIEEYGFSRTTGPAGEKLTGFNRRAPRFPFIVTRPDGRTFKYTEAKARLVFGGNTSCAY